MTDNQNTTAAQPLDLDNRDADIFSAADLDEIEAIAAAAPKCWYGTYQIVDGISDEKAVALIEACSPDTILTLIAQARAAQPESATGTTGASVPTWQVRLLAHGFDSAQEAMEAEIADLRAQMATKGQGTAVAKVIINDGSGTATVMIAPDSELSVGASLYLAAPASAQPAVKLTRDGSGMCEVSLEIDGVWVPVIRDNGDFISHIVEPLGVRIAQQRARMKERFDNRPRTAATADFDLPAPNDPIGAQPDRGAAQFCNHCGYDHTVGPLCKTAAAQPVAPSDAKGKADAAKLAVGVHAKGTTVHVSVHLKQGDRTTVLYSQAHPDCRETAGIVSLPSHLFATSAADAKDAARYRFLRDHGVDHSEPADDALLVYRGFGKSSLLPDQLDAAIDAAMAAAPSSEKGGA